MNTNLTNAEIAAHLIALGQLMNSQELSMAEAQEEIEGKFSEEYEEFITRYLACDMDRISHIASIMSHKNTLKLQLSYEHKPDKAAKPLKTKSQPKADDTVDCDDEPVISPKVGVFKMSPYEMIMLMQIHSSGSSDFPGSDLKRSTLQRFVTAKLIVKEGQLGYTLTGRGTVFLEALLSSIPLPVQKTTWSIPPRS